jgi:hypothetical protein
MLATSITASLSLIEQVAMLPMDIEQALTSTSITLTFFSVDVLTSMFSTYEELFSFAEFATLVGREWGEPISRERLLADKEKYSVVSIVKALIAWAALVSAHC